VAKPDALIVDMRDGTEADDAAVKTYLRYYDLRWVMRFVTHVHYCSIAPGLPSRTIPM
jgi:hypothetical protein